MLKIIMYKVVRNGFRKLSILWANFTTEDEICNLETNFVWWFYRINTLRQSLLFQKYLYNICVMLHSLLVLQSVENLYFAFFLKKKLEMKYVELVHYKSLIFEVKRYPRKGTLFIVSIFIPWIFLCGKVFLRHFFFFLFFFEESNIVSYN